MNSDLERFFENVERIKSEVEQDLDLVVRIREIVLSRRGTFHQLIPKRLALKIKDELLGANEVSVNGDLYQERIPVPSFSVVVDNGFGDLSYLVEDFGYVSKIRYKFSDTRDEAIVKGNEFQSLLLYFQSKGYKPQTLKTGGIKTFGLADGRIVLHDLDCGLGHIENFEDVNSGVMRGQDEFARLAEIYNRLRSPRYRIDLDNLA